MCGNLGQAAVSKWYSNSVCFAGSTCAVALRLSPHVNHPQRTMGNWLSPCSPWHRSLVPTSRTGKQNPLTQLQPRACHAKKINNSKAYCSVSDTQSDTIGTYSVLIPNGETCDVIEWILFLSYGERTVDTLSAITHNHYLISVTPIEVDWSVRVLGWLLDSR